MIYKWTIPHITVWGSCFSLGSRRSPPSAAAAPHSSLLITHSLITHSLPHSLTHYSLTHSLTHSLHSSLTHSLTEELRSPLEELRRAWAPLASGWLSCGRCNTESFLAAFRVQAQYTEPPGGAAARVAAAGPRLPFSWQVQYTQLPGCVSRGGRSTQSLLDELRRAWPPLGRGCLSRGRCTPRGAAARVAAAGPRLPFSWQAQYTELPGCASRGRRSTQSLLAELRRRWGRGCLSRGRRSTQSLLDELRRLPLAWQAQYTEPPGRAAARVAAAGAAAAFGVAGAVHRASWTSCGARGGRWGRGCLWRGQAQYTEPSWTSCGAWPPLGPRLPFAWQAQYTGPPGRAAARVAAAGAAAAFRVAGAVHRASTSSLTHYLSHTNLSHTIFQTPSLTHQLWHTIFHTTLSHTIFHTQLCHTPSCTNHFVTHYLSHTLCHTPSFTFSHTIFHTPLCHTLSFTSPTLSHTIFHTPSVTHHLCQHFVTHHQHHLSHTIFDTPSFTHNFVTHYFSHTIFHTHLCHTPSLTPHLWHTHTIFHTPSQTIFAHHLSHTTLSHTIWFIFDTPSFTHNFITHHLSPHHLCHTPSFTQTTLSHTIFPPPLPLSFLPSPAPQQDFLLNIGRSWLVGLSGPFIFDSKLSHY